MARLLLTGGAPDEPATSDWDAICSRPGPTQLFDALFRALVGCGLPAQARTESSKDDAIKGGTVWLGDERLGVKVVEARSAETTAVPMRCRWRTFGLPGMTIVWDFSLEYAGQLGYVAFRHKRLECEFDSPASQQTFMDIYRQAIGKDAIFDVVGDKG